MGQGVELFVGRRTDLDSGWLPLSARARVSTRAFRWRHDIDADCGECSVGAHSRAGHVNDARTCVWRHELLRRWRRSSRRARNVHGRARGQASDRNVGTGRAAEYGERTRLIQRLVCTSVAYTGCSRSPNSFSNFPLIYYIVHNACQHLNILAAEHCSSGKFK